MAAADIPALLAEADSQLAIDAGAATDNMAIVDSTAMAASDAMTTWSETGMNLTIGNTVTTGIAAEATASIDIAALNPPDFPARAASVVGEPIVVWGIEPIVPETAATAIEGEVSSVFTTSKNEIQAAELQAKSTWTVGSAFKMAGKVALYTIGAAMALDWIGKKLVSIIQVSIEAANPPPWAQSLTAAQKKDLKAVTSAVPRLTILMQGWHAQWSTYSKSFSNSLGNITVNVGGRTTSVPVLSVNEVICHGIPDKRELENGDICNVDITVYYGGFHGDLNETMFVGKPSERAQKIVTAAYECMMKGIGIVRPGTKYRDVGAEIQSHAHSKGFSVVRSYCGHEINQLFHTVPNVPHYAKNKAVGVMKAGHTFTIEPMISEGVWHDVTWPDNWTAVTSDGKLSAQFEHTLLVTESGFEILTLREEGGGRPHYMDQLRALV
uniref:Methionine aminopeptidase n=1 Tax=Amphimedon queenslandica TaxID=400682 RepID=A0A1X7UF24_AMPQE